MYFDPVELDEIFHYYIEHGTGQDATEVLDLAKSLHPEDEVTKRMTVEYLLNEDEAAEALTLLDTFFDERASFHCILRSAALAKLGRLSEAMELARLVSTEYEDENDEDESYISYDLGLGFMNAGEYAIALCYFEDSRKRHPEDIKTLTGILYCNNQLGIREGQEELADRIIKIDPFHYEAWLTKGNLLALKDKFAEAYDAFDYAIAIMNLLYDLSQDKSTEYNSFVYASYAALQNAHDTHDYQFHALQTAYDNTVRLTTGLKSLYNNMRSYFQLITETVDPNELLRAHFEGYLKEIVDSFMYPLKTMDSIPRFRPSILTIVQEWSYEEETRASITAQRGLRRFSAISRLSAITSASRSFSR